MVFWADKASPAEILFGDFFDPAPPAESEQDREQIERLKGILQALRKGLPLNEADRELDTGARFYVLGLAPMPPVSVCVSGSPIRWKFCSGTSAVGMRT